MALANFFDKISLGASQRIKKYERRAFEDKLLATRIAIVYGDNAVVTKEGSVALDLIVRILARLYPNLQFFNLAMDSRGTAITKVLQRTALGINPELSINTCGEPHISLIIGEAEGFSSIGKCFYVGSNGWKAHFSTNTIMHCGETENPFGAAASVCIAAANIFRFLFAEELGNPPLDTELIFSVFSQKIEAQYEKEPMLPEKIKLEFTLVGTGAIGNAVLWTLLQLKELYGFINLIDDQDVSLTNLQRYALMLQENVGKSKVAEIKKMYDRFSNLSINPFSYKWQNVIGNYLLKDLELLMVALDSKEERLLIQTVLPKKIINAWTSQQDIGVSRHLNFQEKACLSCLYLPKNKQKSESLKIAESLKLPEEIVRAYIANSVPVDENFILLVAQSLNIDVSQLQSFIGKPVQIFFSEGICGGRIISSVTGNEDLEVPLAQESILAGVLAAAEIVIESMQLRSYEIEPLTKINLLKPMHRFLLEEESKNITGKCMCTDPIFVNRYREKWVD